MHFRKLLIVGLIAAVATTLIPNKLASLFRSAAFPIAFAQTGRVDGIKITEAGLYDGELAKRVPDSSSPTGYRGVETETKLVKQVTQVPPVLGTSFGLKYTVVGSAKTADIREIIIFPLPGITNPKTGETTFRYEIVHSDPLGWSRYIDYTLGNDWELVPGVWTFELWSEDRKLATQSFTLTKP
jgi:hypothetical protein